MALEIELTDGTTTLDLLGSTYMLSEWAPSTPEMLTATNPQSGIDGDGVTGVSYRDAYESMRLIIQAASKAALQTAIQALETLLAGARRRTNVNAGARVYLQMQTDGDSDTYRSEILEGRFSLDRDALITWAGASAEGVLTIRRRFYWEGPETDLTWDGGGTTVSILNTDGTSPYNLAQFGTVAGTLPAPIRLDLENATGSAVDFVNVYVATDGHCGDPGVKHLLAPGTATVSWTGSTTHSAVQYDMSLNNAWVQLLDGHSVHLLGAFTNAPTTSYLRAYLRYKSGGVYHELAGGREVYTGAAGKELIDFGAIPIPPRGIDATTGLGIVITAYSDHTDGMTLDYVTTFPAHHFKRLYQTGFTTADGASLIDDGIEQESYIEDGSTRYPLLRSSNKALMVWPGRENFLYVQASKDAGHDPAIAWTASAKYRPRRLTV